MKTEEEDITRAPEG